MKGNLLQFLVFKEIKVELQEWVWVGDWVGLPLSISGSFREHRPKHTELDSISFKQDVMILFLCF